MSVRAFSMFAARILLARKPTHLIEQGMPTRVIQVLLGHSHVRTTETYTHVAPWPG